MDRTRDGEAAVAKQELKVAARGKKEETPIFENMDDLQELPLSVMRAKAADIYFKRVRNDDGSVGGFTARSRVGRNVSINPTSVVSFSIVRAGTRIGRKCIIHQATIGFGSKIGEETEIYDALIGERFNSGRACTIDSQNESDSGEDVTIEDDVRLGDFVEISNAYLGAKVRVGNSTVIEGSDGILIGERSKIGSKVIVEDRAVLKPDATVPSKTKVLRGTTIDNFKVPKESLAEAIQKLEPRKD